MPTWKCNDYDKLAHFFWKNPKGWIINKDNGGLPFAGAKGLDLSKIPVAWGGTAAIECDKYGRAL